MRRRAPCVFISIEAGQARHSEKTVRALVRRIKSGITLRQRRARMRLIHSVTVLEALGRDKQPKFGAHIVAPMPNAGARDRLIESLNGSKAYGRHVLAKAVDKNGARPALIIVDLNFAGIDPLKLVATLKS